MTNERFTVINHDYSNTGGHIMVSKFDVYDSVDNATRVVLAGEETISLQTVDTVFSGDFELHTQEDYDKYVIAICNYDELTSEPAPLDQQFDEEIFGLLKYCEFEHYKKDCKYFANWKRIAITNLPNDLYRTLTQDYIDWAMENDGGCVETDGFEVYLNDNYEEPRSTAFDTDEIDRQRELLEDFDEYINQALPPMERDDYASVLEYKEAVRAHMDGKWMIGFNGKFITVENCAAAYNAVKDLMQELLDEYKPIK